MKNTRYDVLLLHPPAIYDFRKKTIFTGALATKERIQYNKISIGIISIADYLDRNGYKVIVDNLADRMLSDEHFDVKKHIENSDARIYAIGLHWHLHSHGAIELAKLCKELHPNSIVIVGGLTATYFHKEIILKYNFVDAVIRGEAEKPFLEFLRSFDRYNNIKDTPNLTYRNNNGEIIITPLMKPSNNLDEFEFTRLDLLTPKSSIFSSPIAPHWSLLVCRGCIYNCTTCGGSSYSYKKYLGMNKPSFRSPQKIVSDINNLVKQGIKQIGLYQDPRMGGVKYWKTLMSTLRDAKLDVERLTMDIFYPANEEFIREIATIGMEVILYICPDTGCEKVRNAQGRNYANKELLDTIKLCHKYHVAVQVFFSVGLAMETKESINRTWDLWDDICSLNEKAISKIGLGNISNNVTRDGPIIGPILLDPGSPAYDFPDKFGYILRFENLEEYIYAFNQPAWHLWINYETTLLNNKSLVELVHESIVKFIQKRERYGAIDNNQAKIDYYIAEIEKFAADEVNKIVEIEDNNEKENMLRSLRSVLDNPFNPFLSNTDSYSYRERVAKIFISIFNNTI